MNKLRGSDDPLRKQAHTSVTPCFTLLVKPFYEWQKNVKAIFSTQSEMVSEKATGWRRHACVCLWMLNSSVLMRGFNLTYQRMSVVFVKNSLKAVWHAITHYHMDSTSKHGISIKAWTISSGIQLNVGLNGSGY